MVTRAGAVASGMRLWVVLWLIMGVIQAQNICNQQEKCDACIQTPGCMWCSKPKGIINDQVMANCQNTTIDDISSFCDDENLENPKNTHAVTLATPLTNLDEKKLNRLVEDKIVQLFPQGMKLKLRKGTPETVTVTYRQAQDYPVDLYYLMDLSSSMNVSKGNLARLGGKLTSTLYNLTSQFTIGFGSFVDKVMMPYVDTSPDKLAEPCPNCGVPYAFRNTLPLQNNGEMFAQKVRESKITGNLDAPEGGFDALMQAMVCKAEIGWRKQSRHIIVFSTDHKFHYAGDGRLAGVVTPNDETCHLNSKGEYDQYDKYDYPSVQQINKVSKEQNINIIFAVSGYEGLYQELSSHIDESKYGLMKGDSSNVVELVVEQYKQISSEVRLSDNSANSPVSIRYSSSCLSETDPVATKNCSGISQGVEVKFDLEIEAIECPKDQEKVIVEVKTLQDILRLEIEIDCNCNCETQRRIEKNATACSHKGNLVCGVCECFHGFKGKNCLCSTHDKSEGKPEDDLLCKAVGDAKVCSGQGYCSCGACSCREEEITGKYCQCNSRKCLNGDERCSGHGSCDCDKCICHSGYTGQLCQCPTNEVCIKEGTLQECSGHGSCDCGKCTCTEDYSGQFCDDCPTCSTGKCEEFRECVQCAFRSPPCKCNLTTSPVESLKSHIDEGARECTFEDQSDGCYFSFAYKYNDHNNNYDIHMKQKKDCPESAPLMGIVFGLVAAIVAIGLLTLLIWKLITTVHDRKEYARFENERKKATWNTEDNPLYKDPSQTIQNPVFAHET